MINDVNLDAPLWKYVDDSSILEVVPKNSRSNLQSLVDSFEIQCSANKFQLNQSKCKEFRVDFSKSTLAPDPVLINGEHIELIKKGKLLGLTISDDLKWNAHVESVIKKAAKRIHFLKELKKARIPVEDLILFYSTCVRPVLEYASQVFHYSLPDYLSNDLERVQKRAFKIIFNSKLYEECLMEFNLQSLFARRQSLSEKTFTNIVFDQSHKLHQLLPERNNYRSLRKNRLFNIPRCKTDRFKNSFIIASALRS